MKKSNCHHSWVNPRNIPLSSLYSHRSLQSIFHNAFVHNIQNNLKSVSFRRYWRAATVGSRNRIFFHIEIRSEKYCLQNQASDPTAQQEPQEMFFKDHYYLLFLFEVDYKEMQVDKM